MLCEITSSLKIIFSDYLEWVAVGADLDHVKRSLEKNREEVDQEVESVNEVEIVKIDRDQGTVKEKIVTAIAIEEVAVVIGKKNQVTISSKISR